MATSKEEKCYVTMTPWQSFQRRFFWCPAWRHKASARQETFSSPPLLKAWACRGASSCKIALEVPRRCSRDCHLRLQFQKPGINVFKTFFSVWLQLHHKLYTFTIWCIKCTSVVLMGQYNKMRLLLQRNFKKAGSYRSLLTTIAACLSFSLFFYHRNSLFHLVIMS